MLISHEVPICFLERSLSFNDYDYALVHLFKDKTYLDFFIWSSTSGRTIILDNSLFELKKAFDEKEFLYYIDLISPSYFIIPDSWGNCYKTLKNLNIWLNYCVKYSIKSVPMAVLQGNSLKDIIKCHQNFLSAGIKKIGISFGLPFYRDIVSSSSDTINNSLGRFLIFNNLKEMGFLESSISYHLLGCSSIQEIFLHKLSGNFEFIKSIDTSLPIKLGVEKKYINEFEFIEKPRGIIDDILYSTFGPLQEKCIMENILLFRRALEE